MTPVRLRRSWLPRPRGAALLALEELRPGLDVDYLGAPVH